MQEDQALSGAAIAVLGLGIEGLDLARFLRRRGAEVTILDTRSAATVGASLAEVKALGCTVRLGAIDPAQAEEFSALYASQSVLLHREPFALRMRSLGRPVSSMTREFLRRWPGPIAGVTGSSGKTTTTSLLAAMFRAARLPHIVGGNIGVGLLDQLAAAAPERWAVLEISHTQLQLTDRSPQIATVTNVTPNHLDQFDWDAYVGLKRNLLLYQHEADTAVLNASEPVAAAFAAATPARITWFNSEVAGADCCFVDTGRLIARRNGRTEVVLQRDEISLRGGHNVENVLAATAAACAAAIELDAVRRAVLEFRPVAHRLEPVATVSGVTFVNDSIATSPERTIAGIRSFEEPLVLLLGGREKRLPLEELAELANQRARAIICFGEAGGLLSEAMQAGGRETARPATVARVATLDEAVRAAAERAMPGDIVLLSPACTSFDAYPNFEKRGEEFRALVRELAEQRGKVGTPSQQ